ncbi:cytochrome b/b6 domain-containing protein [Streptomyces sp. SLBN-118]|uniref:cytochrome b/b6 domain-containing protein n=1 Tax=Streptomyces sp. SLBN-118 TaxID=2768454 RepID=UPI001C930074|nr:cytochrome b/b6 domain-containing protein [Streptomyces sp. SLBN-118]
MTFVIRAGLQIFADHPRLYWTRHSTPGKEWFRAQKPVPADPLWTAKKDSISLPGQVGLPGIRHSIGLARWWHLGISTLWVLNGLVFYVLLFMTGQWRLLVPTSWAVFPHAASVLIQYLSLNWPTETAWASYNGPQQIVYFITVFVAAPAALATGLGMSPALSTRFKRISKVLSIQNARSLHFLVLLWLLLFIVIHVTLVFTTGLFRNLNYVYAARGGHGWARFGIFAASMVVVIVLPRCLLPTSRGQTRRQTRTRRRDAQTRHRHLAVLHDNSPYRDLGPDHFTRRDPERAMRRMLREANSLGLTIRFEPITA